MSLLFDLSIFIILLTKELKIEVSDTTMLP